MLALLRQHPWITVIAVTVVLLLFWGFRPQAVRVETVVVSSGPLTVSIEEEGRTRVIDRYLIAAPVEGVTCRVDLNVGDRVTQGQQLLAITPLEPRVLDPRSRAQARAQVAAARSALRAAEEQALAASSAAAFAAGEFKRLQPLLASGAIAKESFDRASTEAQTTAAAKRSADFQVEVARYELQAARTALEYSAGTVSGTAASTGDKPDEDDTLEKVPVLSPITGRILKVVRECEGPVEVGAPLLEVGDPTALEVEVDVLSADAVKISPGTKVVFERWGGDEPLEGRVRTVEPAGFTKISALGVEEQRVLVISDFTSPPEQWQRLGDGYRVEARFILWHGEKVLQVPTSSLFRRGDGWALFVVEGGRARLRPVRVGQRNGLSAQIIDGLESGETVINHASDEVDDGVRVRGN